MLALNAITEDHAFLGDSMEIIQYDIGAIGKLSYWVNYDFKEI